MARQRKQHTPPTPAQRRRMIVIGGLLVFLACFATIFETIVNEGGNLLALLIVCVVLFLVFILPIITMVRQTRTTHRRA